MENENLELMETTEDLDLIEYSENEGSGDRFGLGLAIGALVTTATILQDGYEKLKVDYSELQKENKLLKNSVINNSNDQSSEFGKFFNNFKNAILDEGVSPDKNLNDFKAFLYNEYLFYGGIEEDDVYFLNQIQFLVQTQCMYIMVLHHKHL